VIAIGCAPAMRGTSLSARQIAALTACVAAGGSMRIVDLVKQHGGRIGIARPCVSRMIRRLAGRGLVELIEKRGRRVSHREHGYITEVVLTNAGVEAANSHRQMERVTLRGGVSVAIEPLNLVLDLEFRGCQVRRVGDRVSVHPRNRATATELAAIRRWKSEVLAILDYEAPPLT